MIKKAYDELYRPYIGCYSILRTIIKFDLKLRKL